MCIKHVGNGDGGSETKIVEVGGLLDLVGGGRFQSLRMGPSLLPRP